MTTRGFVLSAPTRRAARAAAPLLLGALALGACSGDEEPSASPSSSTSTSASVPTSGTPTPSATPSVTPSPTVTATASAPSSPAATSTATPPPASGGSSCPAAKAGKVNTAGMPSETAATARTLHAAAVKCDSATLIKLAKASSTGLVGDQAPAAVFTKTATQHYVALATLLSIPSAESFDGTIQPRVFSEQYAESDAEWGKVVDVGLVSSAEATKMRSSGGYSGYRVGISSDGTWTFFTTGR